MNTLGTFVLILFVHVGSLGNGNSNAITTAEFHSEKACMAAGKKAQALAKGTVKDIEFTCVAKQ